VGQVDILKALGPGYVDGKVGFVVHNNAAAPDRMALRSPSANLRVGHDGYRDAFALLDALLRSTTPEENLGECV